MRLEVDDIGLSLDGETDALFAVGPVGRDNDDFSAGFSIRSASRSSSLNVVPHARHGTDPARGVLPSVAKSSSAVPLIFSCCSGDDFHSSPSTLAKCMADIAASKIPDAIISILL